MKTIYKYQLELTDKQIIKTYKNVEWLTVQLQHNTVCLWGVVDTDTCPQDAIIYIVGTGNPMPKFDKYSPIVLEYIGAVQQNSLVWHIFSENLVYTI